MRKTISVSIIVINGAGRGISAFYNKNAKEFRNYTAITDISDEKIDLLKKDNLVKAFYIQILKRLVNIFILIILFSGIWRFFLNISLHG